MDSVAKADLGRILCGTEIICFGGVEYYYRELCSRQCVDTFKRRGICGVPGYNAVYRLGFEFCNSRFKFGLDTAERIAHHLKASCLKFPGKSFIERLKTRTTYGTASAVIV